MGNSYRAVLMYVSDGDTMGYVNPRGRVRAGKRSVRREQRRDHARQTREALRQYADDVAQDFDEMQWAALDAYCDDAAPGWSHYSWQDDGDDRPVTEPDYFDHDYYDPRDHDDIGDDFNDDFTAAEAAESWLDYAAADAFYSSRRRLHALGDAPDDDAGESLSSILGRAVRNNRQDHL